MSRIYNLAGISEQLSASLPTVRSWMAKGCPFIEEGGAGKQWKLDLAAVSKWREDRAVEAALGDVSSVDLDEARRRKLAAEAALVELELSARRGEFIACSDVKDTWAKMVMAFRAKLLAMPSKLADELSAVDDRKEVFSLLEATIFEALTELSEHDLEAEPG